ncbi:hypothetical protein Mal64_13320 [Pseudobythopirellula maris]|uniref:Uncharacterized protein n=1 Tax=Pseudobythopirellula maris TaxID=2527991 RepID=A0A5C5ZXB8_9BACT|nr:hypothetical protein [Pseudobythopirellula maris]TWT90933.1 hypothetical protein Mal64_13320 [Pseudobythopirellula maris]
MTRLTTYTALAGILSLLPSLAIAGHGWEGKRIVSHQRPNDLFYNEYVAPGPGGGPPAEMYVAPGPVPAHVGHTYTTYQPFMPHEYLYGHMRSYQTHHAGSGWTRTNVRYGTWGLKKPFSFHGARPWHTYRSMDAY